MNKDNFDNFAYAADIDPTSLFKNSDGDDEGLTDGDDEGETKQASVTQSLNYYHDDDYIDNVDFDSEDEFCLTFPRDRNSRNFILGEPQKPDTMGITPAEEEAAMKKYKRERKSFTNKTRVALMKSMASKGVAALP
jgi:hypothetical protein